MSELQRMQRIKDVRIPGARKYEGRTNFLSKTERREKVATPKASGKGMLTNSRVRKEK